MATLTRSWMLAATLLAGCDDLSGFSGEVPPLATAQLVTTGDFASVQLPGATDPDLRVALVWGTQWLPEPICFLPPESPEVEAVITAGCRDPFSFTPERVAATAPIFVGEPTTLSLHELPSADVMVGDVTARVAYGSFVVFDDRDHDGTLELDRPRFGPNGGFGPDIDFPATEDIVYGASFLTMTQPDRRLAFREGGFAESAYYPRRGCDEPLPAFSILSAGGFSRAEAIAATAIGVLPPQPAGSCATDALDATTVEIALRPPPDVREVACEQRRSDSSVRYREPPTESPNLAMRAHACAHIPRFESDSDETKDIIQLIVAPRPGDVCRGLTHYTLMGCDEGELVCDNPEWDYRDNPPAWWPCP